MREGVHLWSIGDSHNVIFAHTLMLSSSKRSLIVLLTWAVLSVPQNYCRTLSDRSTSSQQCSEPWRWSPKLSTFYGILNPLTEYDGIYLGSLVCYGVCMIVNIAVLPQLRMAIWANLISSCGTEERASAGALNHPTRICMVMLAATSRWGRGTLSNYTNKTLSAPSC